MLGHSAAPANQETTVWPKSTRWILASISLVILVLSGCSPRGCFDAFSPQTAPLAPQTIFVATQRDGPSLLAVSGDRDRTLRYRRIDVSIPAEHEVGQIEWAHDGDGFGVAGAWSYPKASGFQRAIQTQPRAPEDVIVVFVTGYNMTLTEAT